MQMNLQSRTIFPVISILVVIMVALAYYNYSSQVAVLNENAEATLRSALNNSQQSLDSSLNTYQQLATIVAANPNTEAAFAKGDRQALLRQYEPAYKLLKERFGLPSIKFDYPPATNFVRIHQPQTFGDDQSAFRFTLVTANKEKKSVRGIEVGRVGLALRGVEPISYNGRHIGSVEFGGDLTPALTSTKVIFGSDVAILLGKRIAEAAKIFESSKSTLIPIGNDYIMTDATDSGLTQKLITAALLTDADRQLKSGTGYIVKRVKYGNSDYFVALGPLKDFSGGTIGYLSILMNQTSVVKKIRESLYINIAIYAGVLLLISWAINLSLKKTVITPVINLTKIADGISMGKLSEKVEVASHDEIATLAKSIDRMRVSMKKLLE
jgi:methyl-accepting chemotaxis protein